MCSQSPYKLHKVVSSYLHTNQISTRYSGGKNTSNIKCWLGVEPKWWTSRHLNKEDPEGGKKVKKVKEVKELKEVNNWTTEQLKGSFANGALGKFYFKRISKRGKRLSRALTDFYDSYPIRWRIKKNYSGRHPHHAKVYSNWIFNCIWLLSLSQKKVVFNWTFTENTCGFKELKKK